MSRFLEASPYASDGGFEIGRRPETIELSDLKTLGHPESPGKAIRAKCLDCCGHDTSEVRKCVAVKCALWPFRMGRNPFWGQKEELEAAE